MSTRTYNDIADWYDQYLRDNPLYREVILPGVLEMVGEVQGQEVCDLACGQGWIARELARRGAHITGLDLADNLLAMAQQHEIQEPLGITYLHGDAQNGEPLADQSFDGAICIMALMNINDIQAAFQTTRRILKPGGWFVFAITHPCFQTPHAHWLTMDDGSVKRVIDGYFDEKVWTSSNPHGVRGLVGEHHRMLSTYLNTLASASFALERLLEPPATGERASSQGVPSLLLVRARAL